MTTISSHKKRRLNPHTIWAVCCSMFILVLTLLIVGGTWYFIQVMRRLDAPVTPTFETNAIKIQEMQESLDRVERAIDARIKKE